MDLKEQLKQFPRNPRPPVSGEIWGYASSSMRIEIGKFSEDGNSVTITVHTPESMSGNKMPFVKQQPLIDGKLPKDWHRISAAKSGLKSVGDT